MSLATTSEPKLLSSPRVESAALTTPCSASFAAQDAVSFASPPRMPFGRNITTAISSMPIQKYQNCGVLPENWSRATMKMIAPTSPP